ncbi:hypothetical protein G9A89_017955 [Geosiphon pyriformis]|nr:hypothetical protein G9A89_017955 [Geosiphon pyriformis]
MPSIVKSTPTKLEVNLRRLLSVCEAQISQQNGLIRGPEKLKFIMNIKHLKKLLENLEKDTNANLDKTAISEYGRKIQRLLHIVDEFKLISPVNRTFSQARFTKNAYQSQNEKNKENELELKLVRQAENELKKELFQAPHAFLHEPEDLKSAQEKRIELFSSESLQAEVRQRRAGKFVVEETSSSMESILQYHQQTQEELTQDLVKMAERLKMNSFSFSDILKRDEKILDEAQSILTGNLDRLKEEKSRLNRYAGQSRSRI